MHLTLWLIQTLLFVTSQTVSSAPSTSTVSEVEETATTTIASTETEEKVPTASPLRATAAGRRPWRRPLPESSRRRYRFEGQNRRSGISSLNAGLPVKPINRFGGKLKFTSIDDLETFHLTQEDFDSLQRLPTKQFDRSSNLESTDRWNRRNYKPEQPLFETHSSDPWTRRRQPLGGKDLSNYKFFESAADRSHSYNKPREFKDFEFITSGSYGDLSTTSTESTHIYSDAEIFRMKNSKIDRSELDRSTYEDILTKRDRSRKYRQDFYETDRNDMKSRGRDRNRSRPTSFFNMSSGKTRRNKNRSETDEDSDKQSRFDDFEKVDHYPENSERGRVNNKKTTPSSNRGLNHRRRTTSTPKRSHEITSPRYRTRNSFTTTSTERNFESKKTTALLSNDEKDGYSIHDLAGPPYHDSVTVKEKDSTKNWRLSTVTTPKSTEQFSIENSFNNMFNKRDKNKNYKFSDTDDMSNFNPHHKYSTELDGRREGSGYSNSGLGRSPDKSTKQTRNNFFNSFGKFDDELAFNSHEFNSEMTDQFFLARENWEKHDYNRKNQNGFHEGFQNDRRINSFERPRNRERVSYYNEEDHFGNPYHEIDTRQYDKKSNYENDLYNYEKNHPQFDTDHRDFTFRNNNNNLRYFREPHSIASVEHMQDYDNKIQHVKLDQLEEFPKDYDRKQFRPNLYNSRQRQIPNFLMNDHFRRESFRPDRNISPEQFATHFNIPSEYPGHKVPLRGGDFFTSDEVRLATLRRKRNNRLSLSDTDREEPQEQNWSLGNLIPDSLGNLFGRRK